MQMVRQITGQQKPSDAKKALAKQIFPLLPKRRPGQKAAKLESLETLSNTQLLRLCRRHAPDLLGPFAPKPRKKKAEPTA
jgi:hypothetical protein